jgi:16S rRNA (guanine966-N2)-methyltransferase
MFSMIETLLVVERPGRPPGSPAIEIGEPDVWADLTVLDLYAGTGALGIEALSRGAAWCDFVENDARVRMVIERNLKVTDVGQRARTIGADVAKVVRDTGSIGLRVPYGVVFMDPPYSDPGVGYVLDTLAGGRLLESGSLVVLEHSRRVDVATLYPGTPGGSDSIGLFELRRRRHGDTEISIYRWREARWDGVGEGGNHRDLSG